MEGLQARLHAAESAGIKAKAEADNIIHGLHAQVDRLETK
jgi:hypothetical protein